MLPGVTSDLQARRISLIHKRLSTAQNSDHLSRREINLSRLTISIINPPFFVFAFKVLPKILADSAGVMQSWGCSGTLDPFDSIPKVQHSLRTPRFHTPSGS